MNEESFDTLDGYFTHTLYKADNYMVSKLETDDGSITITGPSFDYVKGEKYTLTGNYVDHPKYGYQFNMLAVKKFIPNRKDEIIKFLSSASFKGVGKKAASKIYEAYGDECLRLIKDDFSILDNLDLTDKQLTSIKNGIESLGNDNNETILLLISSGFTNSEANRIYYHYKDNTAFILKDNPYRIYLDVYGIGFNKVLQCAKGIEFDDKEFKFKEAYLIYLFKEISFSTGNIYLNVEDFFDLYSKDYSDFYEILNMCVNDDLIINIEDRYYLKQDYLDEKYIRDYLLNERETLIKDELNVLDGIKQNENLLNIKFDDCQIEAIKTFFNESFSLIIGGPGTGKTTIIKTLVNMFKDFYPYNNIMVVAPTGRAAKRINEMCDVESKTIHSLLKWNKETNTFTHKIDNPILYDCLIIDEFSMVDNNLFSSLLKASAYIKKICIIGDHHQLPSIRQGNVLKDLIDSNNFKITYLDINHRQKEGNDIIALANDIVNEKVDFDNYKKDIEFYDIENIGCKDIVNMINKDIEDGYELDDIHVLSPMYRGEYGIDNLNQVLQAAFNPYKKNKKERKVGKYTYRVDDKILQLKNRPTDDVYNGDIGILQDIDEVEKCFVINYQNTNVFYEYDELSDISLAYSLSVHKSQGSEYKIVYFICSRQHINMLYKKLVYTAISRAKTKLVIIGNKEVFINSIKRDINKRKTSLFTIN